MKKWRKTKKKGRNRSGDYDERIEMDPFNDHHQASDEENRHEEKSVARRRYHVSADEKVSQLKQETVELEDLMRDNLERVVDRGESMVELGEKATDLEESAAMLRANAEALRKGMGIGGRIRTMCCARRKQLLIALAFLLLLAIAAGGILFVIECGFTIEVDACMNPSPNSTTIAPMPQ